MKLIDEVHPETHEILENLIEAVRNGEITIEQRNEIVKSCFRAEVERKFLQDRKDIEA